MTLNAEGARENDPWGRVELAVQYAMAMMMEEERISHCRRQKKARLGM